MQSIPSWKHRSRWLAIVLTAFISASCESQEPGAVNLVFSWGGEAPDLEVESLFASGELQVWPDGVDGEGIPLTVSQNISGHASGNPDQSWFKLGEGQGLVFDQLSYGDNRGVVIFIHRGESAESGAPGADVAYYGYSPPFTLSPGVVTEVEVQLLRPAPSVGGGDEDSTNTGDAVGMGAVRICQGSSESDAPKCDTPMVPTEAVSLRFRAEDSHVAIFANDVAFSIGRELLDLRDLSPDADGYYHYPGTWDLGAGLPADAPDGPRSVFLKLANALGLESQPVYATTSLDRLAPTLFASLNREPRTDWVYTDAQGTSSPAHTTLYPTDAPVVLTVAVNEALAAPPTLTLRDGLSWREAGPPTALETGETYLYTYELHPGGSCEAPETLLPCEEAARGPWGQTPYSLDVLVSDIAGNTVQTSPLGFVVDWTAPTLGGVEYLEPSVTPDCRRLLSPALQGPGDAMRLGVQVRTTEPIDPAATAAHITVNGKTPKVVEGGECEALEVDGQAVFDCDLFIVDADSHPDGALVLGGALVDVAGNPSQTPWHDQAQHMDGVIHSGQGPRAPPPAILDRLGPTLVSQGLAPHPAGLPAYGIGAELRLNLSFHEPCAGVAVAARHQSAGTGVGLALSREGGGAELSDPQSCTELPPGDIAPWGAQNHAFTAQVPESLPSGTYGVHILPQAIRDVGQNGAEASDAWLVPEVVIDTEYPTIAPGTAPTLIDVPTVEEVWGALPGPAAHMTGQRALGDGAQVWLQIEAMDEGPSGLHPDVGELRFGEFALTCDADAQACQATASAGVHSSAEGAVKTLSGQLRDQAGNTQPLTDIVDEGLLPAVILDFTPPTINQVTLDGSSSPNAEVLHWVAPLKVNITTAPDVVNVALGFQPCAPDAFVDGSGWTYLLDDSSPVIPVGQSVLTLTSSMPGAWSWLINVDSEDSTLEGWLALREGWQCLHATATDRVGLTTANDPTLSAFYLDRSPPQAKSWLFSTGDEEPSDPVGPDALIAGESLTFTVEIEEAPSAHWSHLFGASYQLDIGGESFLAGPVPDPECPCTAEETGPTTITLECDYTPDVNSLQGPQEIGLQLKDGASWKTDAVGLAFTVDTIRPTIPYVSAVVLPPAGTTDLTPIALTHGATSQVLLTVSEALGSYPEVWLTDPTTGALKIPYTASCDGPVNCAFDSATLTFGFELTVPGGAVCTSSGDCTGEAPVCENGRCTGVLEGEYGVSARVVDVAGNTTEDGDDDGFEMLDVTVNVDTAPPEAAAVNAPDQVSLHRYPWGALSADGFDSVAPMNSAQIAGEPGSAPPGLRVSAWGAAVDGMQLGPPTTVEADGSFEMTLTGTNRPEVYLQVQDLAGNVSEMSRIRDVTWTATMGGKVVDEVTDNPHTLESTPSWRPTLDQSDTSSAGAVDGLETPLEPTVTASGESLWKERPRYEAPTARTLFAMAQDTARGVTVLFGGSIADTWEFDGETWHERDTSIVNPSARTGPAMAYDSHRGITVLFGGGTIEEGRETWEWDGATWTEQQTGDITPGSRYRHAMAYDSARGVTVLFGGYEPEAGYYGDTWEWDGERWSSHESAVSPPAQADHAMAYDSAREVTVLVGQGETWEWDGETWIQRALGEETSAPSERDNHGLAYDSERQVTVLFGGTVGEDEESGELWEWNGDTWTERVMDSASTAPSTRTKHVLVYAPGRGETLLFGGFYSGVEVCSGCGWGSTCCSTEGQITHVETWAWTGETWRQRQVEDGHPSKRSSTAMAYDEARGVTVLFGGSGANSEGTATALDDTWEWDGASWRRWSPPEGTALPVGREGHAMAYDADRQVTILFGGRDSVGSPFEGDYLADSWEWDGTGWTPQAGTPPPARAYHEMAFDRARGVTVLFGGYSRKSGVFGSTLNFYEDTWEYDGDTWTERISGGSTPGPRQHHAMAYDAERHRVVLHGGKDVDELDALWEWDGETWVAPEVVGAVPPVRRDHASIYDTVRKRTVMWGGYTPGYCVEWEQSCGAFVGCTTFCSTTAAARTLEDTWSWDGQAWSEWIDAEIVPPEVSGHVMAFDSQRGVAVLSHPNGELWEFDVGLHSRPGQRFTVDWTEALADPDAEHLGVSVTWRAGGEGHAATDPCEALPGAQVSVWSEGRWLGLAAHEADAETPDVLSWSTDDADVIQRLFYGAPGEEVLIFGATPTADNGCGEDYGTLSTEYVEVVVRYRLPAE
jgi:hypothetical protein